MGFRTWDGKGGDSGDSLSDSLLSFLRAEILLGPRAASLVYVCIHTMYMYMWYAISAIGNAFEKSDISFGSFSPRIITIRSEVKDPLLDQLDFNNLHASDFYIRNKKNEYCTTILIYQIWNDQDAWSNITALNILYNVYVFFKILL